MKMDKRLDVLFVETNLVANIMDNLLVKVRFSMKTAELAYLKWVKWDLLN